MSVPSIEVLPQYLRRLCEEAVPPEDTLLLNRFVTANDREAFELLIARHGPMVLGTARRLVDNTHDAEDVFQAVFLSLARLAKSIRQGRSLPAWLHKTTCRVAAKIRANRLVQSEPPPERYEHCDPGAGLVWREVCQALEEELQRLPERLRSPLLLCYLSGLTRDEAARQLGWSLGTLKRRLEEGRKALRVRLARRGIASVGLALTVLTPEALQAAVSQSLLDSSLRLIFSTGAVVPATISALVLCSAGTMKGLAMKSILAFLAAVAVGVGIYAGTGQADPPKKAEGKKEEVKPAKGDQVVQRDDPLPAGSVLRFGTSRFRHGIPVSMMAVSADGKIAVAVNGNHMLGATRVFDLVSGRVLYTLGGWEGTSIEAAAISPDGRTIVTKQDFSLRVRDAATGKELRKIGLQRTNSWSSNEWVAFTPDGKAIAVTSQGKVIHLIDFASGKMIREFSNDNPESTLSSGFYTVLGIAFSQDGKLMASGGFCNDKGNYFARLWDVETGKEIRRFMHGRSYGIESLAFSRDGKMLVTGAHDAGVRLFDVESGKELRTFPKDGRSRMRGGCVAFAPNGKTVAAARESLRLYDVVSGEERWHIDRKALGLVFTDGGKSLTAAVSGAIYRLDSTTGKSLTPEAGDSVVEQILVTADGRRVVTRGQNGDAHLWDAATGEHLRHVPVAWQRGLALSPDGRFLVWPVADESVTYTVPAEPRTIYNGNKLKLYDVAADRFVERFPGFKGDAHDLTFTNDGKKLITVDHRDGMVRIWNVEAGKEDRSFQAVPEAEKKQSSGVARTLLSQDGKTLAAAYHPMEGGGAARRWAPHLVRLWDVATGKEKHRLNGHLHYVLDMAFSPDGRFLVTAGEKAVADKLIDQVFVWETATGSRVAALPDGLPIGATAVAFSRDGRFVATALPEGVIRLWEVATWTARNEFKGHRDRPTTLTFAPGGQLLSGSLDTTVLAWDIRPPRVAVSVPLESAWNDLAAREACESFKSQGRFLAAPADAVKFFAEKIKPVAALDPKRVQRLLADLGSDKFAVREAASKALLGLDQQAKPYLEETLKSAESAEVRLRVKRILEQKQRAALTSEEIRQIRAVMVLERIGDGESKNLLKRWARGPVGALLTMETSAALKRLEAVSKANR
ncbi:MAG: sigma-70 family RNA polymerase sigma factor [Planctomycetes bacterium]|nr:sigma-70 family RNA polymerase sigma factor [Planctomycetota bacterium]